MSEIITLSSDEETDLPQIKRLKPNTPKSENCVIIDDEISPLRGKLIFPSSLFENGDEDMCKNFVISDVKSLSNENENLPVAEVKSMSKDKEPIEETFVIEDVEEVNDIQDPQNSPKESKVSNREKFNEFLEICSKAVKNSRYSRLVEHIPKIRSNFEKDPHFDCDSALSKSLEEHMEKAKQSESNAVTSFKEIFFYVCYHSAKEFSVSEDERDKLKKLERAMRLILKKLKRLAESEVGSEDDENSPYIQSDRYARRLMKIHEKYCEILKLNKYSGRLVYQKIVLDSSKYSQINLAISKEYKNNKFPSYYDVEECIRECIKKDDDLNLTESEIVAESSRCFKKLGKLMQSRRKTELYDYHSDYIKFSEDLAKNNPEMDRILRKSYQDAQSKMDDIFETYARNQENNVPANEDEEENSNSSTSSDID